MHLLEDPRHAREDRRPNGRQRICDRVLARHDWTGVVNVVIGADDTIGERLTFDISYGFITAGQAVMSIPGYRYVNGRKTFDTRVEAASSSTFAAFCAQPATATTSPIANAVRSIPLGKQGIGRH